MFSSTNHSQDIALSLLKTKDNEFHGVFDWASDAGDLNAMEWLLRKSLNPLEHDDHGRGALYWATKSRQVDAVRLLVFACGCDPLAVNTMDGECPLSMAKKTRDNELINAFRYTASLCSLFWRPCHFALYDKSNAVSVISVSSRNKSTSVLARISGDEPQERRSSQGVLLRDEASTVVPLPAEDCELGNRVIGESELYVNAIYRNQSGYMRTLAHPPKNDTSFLNALVYTTVVSLCWLLNVVLPFWVWAMFLGTVGYLYRFYCHEYLIDLLIHYINWLGVYYSKYSKPIQSLKHKVSHTGGRVVLPFYQVILFDGSPFFVLSML